MKSILNLMQLLYDGKYKATYKNLEFSQKLCSVFIQVNRKKKDKVNAFNGNISREG